MEKIKYYELKQIMHQNDEQFIDILNRCMTIYRSHIAHIWTNACT
jgi:hypothetical protein